MNDVKVEIGTSSPVMMTSDEARKTIKRHLQGKQFKTVTLNDERWTVEIETMTGAKAKMTFPEEFGDGPIEIALS